MAKYYSKEEIQKFKNFMEEYLQLKGIDTNKLFRCFSKTHEDKHPSMSFYKKNQTCTCFGCGEKYDIFKLVGQEYGITNFYSQIKKVEELYNNHELIKNINDGIYSQKGAFIELNKTQKIEPSKKKKNPYSFEDEYAYKKYIYECKEKNNSLEKTYLETRGISKDIQKKFFIGYDDNFKLFNLHKVAIIPTAYHCFTARNVEKCDSKDRVIKVGKAQIFSYWDIPKDKTPVFVVEGEIDALSFYEIGKKAISLGSTSDIYLLANKLKEDKLQNKFILMLDNDESGKSAQKKLFDLLKENQIDVTISTVLEKYNYKDPNEFLMGNKEKFIEETNILQKEVQQQEQTKGWGARTGNSKSHGIAD